MGRKSITGGVIPAGLNRIRFDFTVDGHRFRPTVAWIPNETNLQRARAHLARIKVQIVAGTFCFADEFPRYRGLEKLPPTRKRKPLENKENIGGKGGTRTRRKDEPNQ